MGESEKFPMKDSQRDEGREALFKALDATREAFRDVPFEEIEREVAKAIAESRQKRWPKAPASNQP